ncbi:sensor histidine kinase [Lutimonas sp.]|uniref:sensor histidine kinase n=1 Tax=Lutimonas sp. TaxID=1872403 RepID=UPI003D9B64DB
MNQAYTLSKAQENNSLLKKILSEKTLLHSGLKENDSAKLYAHKLLLLARQTNDSVYLASAYNKLGIYNNRLFFTDSAYLYFNKSQKIYVELKDSMKVAGKLLNMAIIFSNSGSYNQSDQLAINGLNYLNNKSKGQILGSLYNCMAINSKKQQDYTEALYWYKKASEATNNKKNRLVYVGNTANVYRLLGDYDTSISINQALFNDSDISVDTKVYSRVLDNLTYSKWKKSQSISLEKDFQTALEIREQENYKSAQVTSHAHLSEFYLKTNRAKSRMHAKKMYHLATELNAVDDRLEALQALMASYENDDKKYNTYAREYIHLEDSIFQVRSRMANKYQKIQYDSELNRSENIALRTKSIEEQLALEKSKRMNSIYIALGVISMFVFAFIILILRERYQKEKLEEVVLTESRISKKVHDEVANDVYLLMSKMEKEASQKEQLIHDLDGIYRKTRDISREHSALDLHQDFGELISDLLMNYKSDDINIITKGLKKVKWDKINPLKKTAIFRVIQELMTNMSKHSQAQIVILTFDEVKKKVLIKYSDDGIGCAIKKNNGLLNAENRIISLRGKITLQSEKNKGFKATLIV